MWRVLHAPVVFVNVTQIAIAILLAYRGELEARPVSVSA